MPIPSAEQVLQTDDLERVRVDVPEWGEDVYVFVRMLRASEMDAWRAEAFRSDGERRVINETHWLAKLCARAICDDKGERIFSDAQVAALGNKSSAVLDRIWTVAARLSGITEEERKDLGKGSEKTPTSDSGSDSPLH